MSRERTTPDLVELTRRFLDAANRRDFDTMMSFYAPDAVVNMTGTAFGTFEGRAAIRGFFEDWLGMYDDFQVAVEELRDLGNGVTFVVPTATGHPVGSSGELQIRVVLVTISTEGVIVRQTSYHYTDIDEARAAAQRLAEGRAQPDG
jgi:ketosteroid isomerase-like protein